MPKTDIEKKIKEFLEKETKKRLTDQTDLIGKGIVDSFLMMKLISFIEKELEVEVDMELVRSENFSTVSQIVQQVVIWLKEKNVANKIH